MDIQLSFAMDKNPRNRAIFDGEVKPEGIEFVCTSVRGSELFWRQLRFAEFDVSEMSLSSFMIMVANGDDRYVGLPVFCTRHFFQNWAVVRKDAGIERPEDLKGKRLGVPEFQQTAALWARGILKDDFGVDQTEIEWFMERLPEHSHGGVTGFKPPPGTTVNFIPAETSIGEMMLERQLDGTLLWFPTSGAQDLIDRNPVNLGSHPDMRWLFPDKVAEGTRYFAKWGFMPINHMMVLRRSVAERYPWAPLNIYKAMVAANEVANRERAAHNAYHVEAGLVSPEAAAALARPVVRHGLKENGKAVELAARYSNDQGLTPRLLTLADIYHPATLDE